MRSRLRFITSVLITAYLLLVCALPAQAALDRKIVKTLEGLVRPDVANLNWTKIQEGPFLLHYYRGSDKDIYLIREAYKKVLPKLESYLGFKLKEQVIVLIFPDETALNNYLESEYANLGFSGFSFPEKMTIIVPLVGRSAPSDFIAVHELSHLLLGKLLLPNKPPLFFDEGLASYLGQNYIISPYRMQIPPDFNKLALTVDFLPFDSLIEVENLGDIDIETVSLFYIEAESFLEYYFKDFGEARFTRLLNALRTGSDLKQALSYSTGLSPEQIDIKWRASLAEIDEASAAKIISELPEYDLTGAPFGLSSLGSAFMGGFIMLLAIAWFSYRIRRA